MYSYNAISSNISDNTKKKFLTDAQNKTDYRQCRYGKKTALHILHGSGTPKVSNRIYFTDNHQNKDYHHN